MNERGQRGSRHEIRRCSERETRDRTCLRVWFTHVLRAYIIRMHVYVFIFEKILLRRRVYLLEICHLAASSLAR